MGSVERRTREREGTRRRILDAAREMFVEAGYEATTMRAIADRIEYTPTAIYHHFRNKEDLFAELCSLDFRSLAQVFQRIGTVADPFERLERIGESYVEFAIQHPMHYRLMFMTPRPVVDPRNRRGDPTEDAYSFLRETCAEAIATGRLRPGVTDPDELAQMLWSGVHGLVSLHIAKADDPWVEWRDLRATSKKARTALLEGLMRATGA